ncbi:ABC transporter ATP-binding protein [Saccharicrinis sp. FJH62]|uniref:ABC transporter ATP-binding protein n=1 Tax=Saccharicrinis sp. FJH62 TaxID=3344657 RepID=UPI0035D4F8C5
MVEFKNIPFDTILQTTNLSIGYKSRRKVHKIVMSDLNLSIFRGEMICLIGPNGVGKSTLIRTISGMQPAIEGETYIENIPLNDENLKQLSRMISVVLTDRINPGHFTVFDMVAMGRHPHTNWFGSLGPEDMEAIETSLKQVGMLSFSDQPFENLSDGERQRVMIARALSQDCPLILLDEPTAHLDLPNRVEIMKLLRSLARRTNKSILISTHELDLALQTADRVWLMTEERGVITGTPEDLVLSGEFEHAFHNQSFDFEINSGTFKVVYEQNKFVKLKGDNVRVFWTRRALERHGYRISDEAPFEVIVNEKDWLVERGTEKVVCNTIWEVLNSLIA